MKIIKENMGYQIIYNEIDNSFKIYKVEQEYPELIYNTLEQAEESFKILCGRSEVINNQKND